MFCNNHLVPRTRPRVLVTRSPQQASALADRLRELGAEPVLIPTIETVDPASFAALDAALAQLSHFHWLLFTSANAVEALVRRLAGIGRSLLPESVISPGAQPLNPVISTGARSAQWRDPCIPLPPILGSSRIAAIGPATARTLADIGLAPDLLPPQAVAESLAEALLPHAHQPDGSPTRFLLLRAAGAEVTVGPAYRTVVPAGAAERIRQLLTSVAVDAVTFTSSSTARNLFTLLEAAGMTLPENVVRASIGPITSATLQELGFPPHVEAPQAAVESLAEILVKYLQPPRSR